MITTSKLYLLFTVSNGLFEVPVEESINTFADRIQNTRLDTVHIVTHRTPNITRIRVDSHVLQVDGNAMGS